MLTPRGLGSPLKQAFAYRGTSLTRKRNSLGPYRRPMPRVQGGVWGGGHFLMGEVLLHGLVQLRFHQEVSAVGERDS